MPVRHGALGRAVVGVTLDQDRAKERRAGNVRADAAGELIYEHHVTFSGKATRSIVWDTLHLDFSVSFYPAQYQRDPPFELPTFWCGIDLSNSPTLVLITAVVRGWDMDEAGAITGATVAVGACVPGADGDPAGGLPPQVVDYAGTLHLHFQGYGAPVEDDSNTDVGT